MDKSHHHSLLHGQQQGGARAGGGDSQRQQLIPATQVGRGGESEVKCWTGQLERLEFKFGAFVEIWGAHRGLVLYFWVALCVYCECVGGHGLADGRHSQQRKGEAGVCVCGCVGVHSWLAVPTFLGVIS